MTGTTVTAPATGLQVSVASDNPVTGSIISSSNGGGTAARVPVLGVNFTAGNSGAVTISSINFHKVGVLSDSSVSGAYLVQNGQVVAQYNSINQGVISFTGLQLSVPAGQTLDLQLAIDPAGGLAAGNTVSFSLNAASDVTSFDASNNAVTASGAFPVQGNTFTVTTVTNPQLSLLSIASTSIANSVTAGTQGNIVGGWNFSVQNNLVWLKGISFHVIGSANKGDLRNVKLMINGTQVGATLATVPASGIAYFNAAATPGTLNTGSNNVQLYADVMGSPSYNFQFEILNSYDVLAVDSQYNVPIAVTNNGGTGTLVGIQQGTITMSQDASTPTGNVAVGQSGVTLAKFDIYAGGEAVKIKWLDFSLAFTGVTGGASLGNQIRNIALTDDAGGQVGTTINTPPSGNACGPTTNPTSDITGATTAGNATFTSAGPATYEDCFGTNSSNINYIVPANTTRVLSLKADVQSGASFGTVTAALLSDSSNLQGLTSSQIGSSSGAVGSALSLSSTLLTVAQNNALATPVNVTPNSAHVKIGSYNFQASSASGVQVNTLSLLMGGTGASSFQNLGVFVNGTQFGTTQGVVSAAGTYSFSGTPFTVPAGSSVNVDVYADLLSSATGTITYATTLSGCSATGVTSFNAITCSSVAGQNVHLAGAAAITVTADASQPATGQIVMGSAGNTLAVYRFTETTNAENVKVTQLTINDAVNTGTAQFSNLTLWNGSTELGSVGAAAGGVNTVYTTTGTSTIYATGTITVSATASSSQGVAYVTINGFQAAGPVPATTSTTATGTIAAAINTIITNNSAALQATSSVSGGIVTITSKNLASSTFSVFDTPGNTYSPGNSGVIPVGTASTLQTTVSTSTSATTNYTFQIQGNPIIVPQGNSVSVTLKGDASPWTNGATDNQTNAFSISTSTSNPVTALGNSSNLASTVTLSTSTPPQGNTQTLLRSILTVSTAALGNASARAKNTTDNLGTITFSANNSGSVGVGTTTITLSGSGASSTLTSLQLIDQNGNDVVVANEATSTITSTTTAPFSKTFSFTPAFQVSAGGSYSFTVRVNSINIPVGGNGISQSLSAAVQGSGDVMYSDGCQLRFDLADVHSTDSDQLCLVRTRHVTIGVSALA